jgi:hypothetical protein
MDTFGAMSLELVPLCSATVTLAAPIQVSPSMMVGEVDDMVFVGERLSGRLKGKAAADWLTVGAGGYGELDVRLTMETHDGAIVYVSYKGRLQFATGIAYSTPLFHTGDERYAWLNSVQAVAKGTFTPPSTLVYEMYELR